MTTANPYIVGPGSFYYQLEKVLEIGQDASLSIDIPACDHSFAHDEHGYVVLDLDDAQQQTGMEQAQEHVKQIRQGAPVAQGNIDYIESAMAEELANGEGWLAEQK